MKDATVNSQNEDSYTELHEIISNYFFLSHKLETSPDIVTWVFFFVVVVVVVVVVVFSLYLDRFFVKGHSDVDTKYSAVDSSH